MLHEATTSSATENSLESNETNTSNENNVVSHLITKTTFDKSRVLLATARIQVCSSSGRTDVIRALLDQGSVTSLISENLAQRLRLSRTRVAVSVTGIGETQSVARHAALISVSSKTGKGPSYSTTAIIMRSLTKYTPPKIAYQISLAHLSGLPWADPQPSSADPIEMIIGADLYGAVLLPGLCSGSSNQPTAQNSIFGWIMSGPISTSSSSNMSNVTVNHTTLHDNLDDEIRQFWEVEELPQVSYLTPEEQRCEEHFRATHSRDSNGRYVVRLPFKANPPIAIGESRHIASSLLSRLEGRLQNKRDIASEYREFLLEYENLGHMKKVDEPVSASQSVYIPHHAVIREHSSTTRLRVVFNASQSTSNGSSLNDHLMIGPKLQTDLRSVILRWRQHRYVFTADIAKMYRQIQVDPRDQDYQRILWRSSSSEAVQDYRLLTVTYGMACAPYLALRTIQQLTQDEGAQFPLAQSVLRNQIYVDDCIFGADDKPLARQIRNQLISLLQKGGFLLRKWASNCPTLLNDLPVNEKSLSQGKILQSDESFKVLGVTWLPATDTFQFSVEVTTSIPDSKRKILSTIAKLFDPLGWLAPVIITAKIIMQQLWATKCSWDDPIPPPLMQKWHNYHTQLIQLRNISLPRWTAFGSDTSHCELHGFADASSVAYAAVIYLKVISLMGSVTVSLLIAKSKVAPLKPLTIPRLELCAAALLARTMSFARTTLELSTIPCHCWTDSTVTLAWLRQSPSRWKTFVAHRVNDVQTLIPDAKWHHVPTHQNPADLASRGVTASSFAESSLWWQGPEWLKLPSSMWPNESRQDYDTSLEKRSTLVVQTLDIESQWDLASRYSSWPKLLRITAYLIRFINKLRNRIYKKRSSNDESDSIPSDIISVDEYKHARLFWLRVIQQNLFLDDVRRLKNSKPVAKTSKLISLNPFLDDDDLIRVGGRLRKSDLSYNAKCPLILAAHPLVTLIIQHAHLRSLHAGTQLTLCVLREEFWILRARQTVRAVLYRCITCTREKAVIPSELMGDLPAMRIRQVDRAFLHCGLDYAGPVPVRLNSGRGYKSQKAYIAVFVCMTTRAIHLDLVSDYTTAAFLAAYARFCSRRGMPTDLYSDNAKNFRGADRELKAAIHAAKQDSNLRSKLSCDGVRWHFIPPSAPHFGGLWEAGVRSVKYHLKRVIGSHTLTFEELTTLLYQIEACLNSRPIAPMSDNLDDYSRLTPGHFLIGSALTTPPSTTLLETKETRLTRWQLVQQKSEVIWKAWSNDYLTGLQQRSKWRVAQKLARVGRLVLLRDPLAPPCKWELGRIIECHTGDDGLTRVVTVKTSKSTYKRSIVKLCFLPVDLNETST
ncbi:PREDICTED: uncharacterized protein LOC108783448 [Cyphomyrmex costatus]|uniref:uncharacterized protein LOC108783448 n=1 Tax=Cyphomyrmex costatus TaxID=456900 RepID=UPI000852395F|nr:PREDICTED: uncharacterized protein LOC108783448 [Cyphomyrmex costatus]